MLMSMACESIVTDSMDCFFSRTPFSSFAVFCGTGFITLTMLIAALITTVGYSEWCGNFENAEMLVQHFKNLSLTNVKTIYILYTAVLLQKSYFFIDSKQ